MAENDYVVQRGGVANGAPERWSSTHTCRCSSPPARPATALMACRPTTARQAPPSRRARAQRQRWQQISFGDFLLTTCAIGFWRTLPSQPRADLCGHLKSPPLVVSAACPNGVILSGQYRGNSFCPENEKRLREIIRARAGPDNFPALGVFRDSSKKQEKQTFHDYPFAGWDTAFNTGCAI